MTTNNNTRPAPCIRIKPGVTAEKARTTRARAWLQIFTDFEKEQAAEGSGGERALVEKEAARRAAPSGTEDLDERPAREIIPTPSD